MNDKKKKKKAETPVKPEKKEREEKGKDFDFGGIPERDLKKNLGCG